MEKKTSSHFMAFRNVGSASSEENIDVLIDNDSYREFLLSEIRSRNGISHQKSLSNLHVPRDNIPRKAKSVVSINDETNYLSKSKSVISFDATPSKKTASKFFITQIGYIKLRRCDSEDHLDINKEQNSVERLSDLDTDSSQSLIQRPQLHQLNVEIGEPSSRDPDPFEEDMDDLTNLLQSVKITSNKEQPPRVRRVFNLTTWLETIREMPHPGAEPIYWPIEQAWRFPELQPRPRSILGKRVRASTSKSKEEISHKRKRC